jgi:hypothetical protein
MKENSKELLGLGPIQALPPKINYSFHLEASIKDLHIVSVTGFVST